MTDRKIVGIDPPLYSANNTPAWYLAQLIEKATEPGILLDEFKVERSTSFNRPKVTITLAFTEVGIEDRDND